METQAHNSLVLDAEEPALVGSTEWVERPPRYCYSETRLSILILMRMEEDFSMRGAPMPWKTCG
jgi:hypothetical protein